MLMETTNEDRLREKLWEYVTLCEDLEQRMDVAVKTIEVLTERIIDMDGALSSWQNAHQDRNPSPCKGELEGE
jgi:hypothetical protein